MAEKADEFKRKSWRSGSVSSEEESLSPLDKRAKITSQMSESFSEEADEVVAALEMAKGVMPKLELVVQKLDNMEKKLDNLEGYVKVVDGKVNLLQEKGRTI